MSKTKSSKGAKATTKAKQRAEKAKPAAATNLIPELAAMQLTPTMVAKLEALCESDQETILNYVNSGSRIADAYKRLVKGQTLVPVEPATTDAAQAPNTTGTAEGATPAPENAKPARTPKAKKEPVPKKLSAIDAAARCSLKMARR